MHYKNTLICLLLPVALFISCGGSNTAQIWTDRPEMAIYSEYFNTVQNQYKVTVQYHKFPAEELTRMGTSMRERNRRHPDIIAASWLKNSSTTTHFKSIDNIFGVNKLSRNVFYPRLLASGRVDRKLYLLPVSFNAPALVFSKNREEALSSPFTIDFDEIKNSSKQFNVFSRGAYTRMGFSPLWDLDFLLITANLYGASFREASPLAWNTSALESSMDFIYKWTNEVNTSNQEEEEFTFKYFIEPEEKLINSRRILFSYMESSRLFTLSDDTKNDLDFRWIANDNKIPLMEDTVYMGILKKGKSGKAANAFILWFFSTDTQRLMLEISKNNRLNETIFGICGGFSSLVPVSEQIFPRFYPSLLGRMPPADYLMPAGNLPANWVLIKERVVLPYLEERARKEKTEENNSLEKRIADWLRINSL